MNFIEKIFGFSPDADTGSLELLLLLAPVVAVLVFRWWRKRQSKHGDSGF